MGNFSICTDSSFSGMLSDVLETFQRWTQSYNMHRKISKVFQRNFALAPTETAVLTFLTYIQPSCRGETAPCFVSFGNYNNYTVMRENKTCVLPSSLVLNAFAAYVEDPSYTPCLTDMKWTRPHSVCCVTSRYLSLQRTFMWFCYGDTTLAGKECSPYSAGKSTRH